uniref:Uncharacterized protein n=1 Tax=Eimeria tenella TaxID=5802 RepID=H9BA26_EIMTE|nr:hypothetical protein [Eimeria tenella]
MFGRIARRCCCRWPQQLLSSSRGCCELLLQLLQQVLLQLLQMRPRDLLARPSRAWGRLLARCRQQQQQQQQQHLRVLLVGRRFSGKTALVYRLKLGAFIPTRPSVGNNTESFVLHCEGPAGAASAAAAAAEEGSSGCDGDTLLSVSSFDLETPATTGSSDGSVSSSSSSGCCCCRGETQQQLAACFAAAQPQRELQQHICCMRPQQLRGEAGGPPGGPIDPQPLTQSSPSASLVGVISPQDLEVKEEVPKSPAQHFGHSVALLEASGVRTPASFVLSPGPLNGLIEGIEGPQRERPAAAAAAAEPLQQSRGVAPSVSAQTASSTAASLLEDL